MNLKLKPWLAESTMNWQDLAFPLLSSFILRLQEFKNAKKRPRCQVATGSFL